MREREATMSATTNRSLRTNAASIPRRSPGTASEAAQIRRARHRDWGAFEELVQRYHGHIYTLALHALQEPGAAEQALQATFVAAWEGLPDYRGWAPFSSWMAWLCTREVVRLLNWPGGSAATRPSGLRLVPPRPQSGGPGPRREDGPGAREARLRSAIASTVAGLPVARRVSFVFGELGGVSSFEIALALGVDPPIVKRHIHEATLSVLEAIDAFSRAS
jgi:RNA polymerase sigma-70 factor (ECF subfamily)